MFTFAFSFGLYAYIIFLLGLAGWLYKPLIIGFTFLYIAVLIYWKKEFFSEHIHSFIKAFPLQYNWKKNLLLYLIISLIMLQSLVNLLGALGPELAFDALWYHLTFPKMYLDYHAVLHIPGGLLYYSDMPKLGELLYVASFAFGNEIWAKVLHFAFGLFILYAVYKISRRYCSQLISYIAVLIFSSNLVFAWESTTAYIDLIRTFFEVMALWGFLEWWEKRETKWIIESAALVGLAITTKLLALGTLCIFVCLLLFAFMKTKNSKGFFSSAGLFILIALLVPLPWFVFSYIHTGNPIYPFFTPLYEVSSPQSLLNPITFLEDTWNIFTHAEDPLSPLYLIFAPIIFLIFPKLTKEVKLIFIYSLLGILMWYITPRTGGGRFILVYLPALSIVCAAALGELMNHSKNSYTFLSKFLISCIILVALSTIEYRSISNSKYVPVMMGQESKQTFLSANLNFSYGDFYDVDGYFQKNILPADRILLYGFHNLTYVTFPFIHESWVEEGDTFNYIATQNTTLPDRFKNWKKVYHNEKTHVTVYTDKRNIWRY